MPNKLRLTKSPYPTSDSSGLVAHEIQAVTAAGVPIPGRFTTVLIPEAALDVVLAMPDGTPAQKAAKNTAYKNLIAQRLAAGWSDTDLQALVDMNAEAQTAATGADTYITVTLAQQYPLDFSL